MKDYKGDFADEVRSLCSGCIDIIIAYVKLWPEFMPDVTVQTLQEVVEFIQSINNVLPVLLKADLAPEEFPQFQTTPEYNKAYLQKWTDPLFLNDPSTCWDSKPVTAQDLYIPFHFRFGDEDKRREDQDNILWRKLSQPGGHLVLGDPGIGKSTLISRYLAEQGGKTPILAYPLTEFGLTGAEQHPGALLLQKIGRTPNSLGETVLFLDGLDECSITPEMRAEFLRRLQADWMRSFPWVVTCRLNYIPERSLYGLTIPRFTLCPLNPDQIKTFLSKYESKAICTMDGPTKAALTDAEQSNVFGIPLILYLITATGLQISPEDTLVTVYDKLFAAHGHFYQRSYDLNRRRLSETYIQKIRQMSRDIALWMLLCNSEKLLIPEDIFHEIEQVFGTAEEEPLLDTFLHQGIVEGEKTELCFVHLTMYEYFTAEGFVSLAVDADTPEKLSRIIAWYWHETRMDDNVWRYLSEKLGQKRSRLSLDLWERAGLLLLEKGVRRCLPGDDELEGFHGCTLPDCLRPSEGESLARDRRRENALFWNLCHSLVSVRHVTGDAKLVYQGNRTVAIPLLTAAIWHCGIEQAPVFCPEFYLDGANLAGVDFSGTDLVGVALSGADLSKANLAGAYLSGANLSGGYLSGAILYKTDLSGANLSKAGLYGANLSWATLSGSDLSEAHLNRANLTKAHLTEADLSWAHLNGAVLSEATLTKANLSWVYLSEEHPQAIGYEQLRSCTFDAIFIGDTMITRSDFFARFFPDKPYSGDNP